MIASSVPRWRAASNARLGSSMSNSQRATIRWAEDEIGKELGDPLQHPEQDGLKHRHGRPPISGGTLRSRRSHPCGVGPDIHKAEVLTPPFDEADHA